ncbi:cytochrome P450 [Ceratobasidium sp. AG-I]|nr:cytochrome P450 [Ceratobasidium sp. AG-I]
MVRHPEVALKIQAELDSVLGPAERLPRADDRERMPYVQNTLAELLRWQPVTPLAIPHATTEDDHYNGYRIPKGSIVMGNTWAITRNESVYPDPERFNPDRFLDPNVPFPPAFGYGRRVCPGSQFAESNLFILISSLMYVFDICRAHDESGNEIIPEVIKNLEPSVVAKPLPFKFNMKPRSEAHKSLVMNNAHGM